MPILMELVHHQKIIISKSTPQYPRWGNQPNNIFTKESVGRPYHLFPSLLEGGGSVTTYEELQLIISVTLLIVAILNCKHRK